MIKNPFKLRLVTMALASALVAPAAVFAAEDEGEEEQKLTIVGSHIKRSDTEGPSPVTSLTSEDIELTGVTDLIGLFAKLPISGQGTFSTQANSSDDTANGGSSVSLRGLGADSTLILVNGRRVSVSPFAKNIDTAFVDINNIPLSAIERVDILKDGASATYGSDAIAGVINVVLKDDFDGVEISGKYGTTADGGGEETNVSVLWGNVNERSSHTFIMDYFNREEVLYADRSYSRTSNQTALRPNDPDAVDFRSSSGIPGTIALASDPTVRVPDTFGNDVCAPEDIVGTLCRYDYAPFMSMFPSTERFSFNYMSRYDLTNSVTAFTELNGQNARSTIRGAGSPSFNELFMAGDNPNHPFANDPGSQFFQQDLTMRRRTVDIGNREKRVETNYYRAVLGLEGSAGDWDWTTAISYIKNNSTERGVDGFPNSRRVQEAIDSGLWNPFEPSSNTQEALDFIETTTTRVGKSTHKSFDATMSGPIANIDAGEIMLAVGLEYREEKIADNPDDQFLRGDVFGTEATQANGKRDNTSIFAELAIPVTDDFELQLAVRNEDYSDFGTTTNPKVAFRWAASDDLVVRGSYGTAFRAPSLHQLGLGRTDESPSLIDTVRCNAVGNVNNACVPQEYTAVFEGNPDLGPEESTSYNFGVIYDVNDDWSISVDYYNYEIEDIIDSDTQFVFTNFGSDPNVVERLPSADPNDPGEVVRIFDSFQNIGDLNTSGLDFDIRYGMDTDVGRFNFAYVLNYVLDFEELRPDATGGQRVNRVEGDFEQPEMRWTLSSEWSNDESSAALALNFIDEFKGDADAGFGDKTVDSWMTVDASYNYGGIENVILSVGATNLFNEEPPYSHHDFMGFVTTIHSGQGRFTYVRATYTFD
ncbi:TonB-dependent receptor [Aliikangiella marina]|uniref:TonB-dependent receptor n=1 Tax=Aliikangiella marina TaxID=1712262 RepID=A0A545T6X7_9GAMM|nr:TonB-dependent receptor [Aliikangiella marina]TQV72976.1 TonB-dependent receptor [Aliikangiella marina]